MGSIERVRPTLPSPKKEAYYFSQNSKLKESFINANTAIVREVKARAGTANLVSLFRYGSQVTGDASATSRHDLIIVVDDIRKFHEINLTVSPKDYGHPRSSALHSVVNRRGLNFYRSSFTASDGSDIPVKYAVISKDDFIKGCSETLSQQKQNKIYDFGWYVAGRMQKVAIYPLYQNPKFAETIGQAINTARVDGVWLALGLVGNNQNHKFTFDELVHEYVSLSYKTDLRVEKKDKVDILIKSSKDAYREMLDPIINDYIASGLISRVDEASFKKIESLSINEVTSRLKRLRRRTIGANIKNWWTGGLVSGIIYETEKIRRVQESKRRKVS